MLLSEKYPYSIALVGCYVLIKNGMAGTYKIHQNTLAVDGCSDGISVLCDESDKKDFISILDLSKMRTGFNPKITTLYPKNFGYETITQLVDALSVLVGRNIALKCCLEMSNELTVHDSLIFCGAAPDVIEPILKRLVCFNIRHKDAYILDQVDPIAFLFSLLPMKYVVNGLYTLEIKASDLPGTTDPQVLYDAMNDLILAFYNTIPGVAAEASEDSGIGHYKITMDILVCPILDVKYANGSGTQENFQWAYSATEDGVYAFEYADGTLGYTSSGNEIIKSCDFGNGYSLLVLNDLSDFLIE